VHLFVSETYVFHNVLEIVKFNVLNFRLRLHDTSSRNTPPPKSEWESSLPPDCFVSRGSTSYALPNILRVVKSRRMRWAGHVARMGEVRGVHRVLVGKPE
jgi:hypothetical protein